MLCVLQISIEHSEMVKADKFLYPIERYLHELEDEEGNVFVWISRGELECGQSYIVTGTVKEHKTYKGVKQTVIQRYKYEMVEETEEE